MDEIKFSSINELYNRLKPALNTKKDDLRRSGIAYIMVEDIWNYLRENTWNNSNNLKLYEMVDDIMNVDSRDLDLYIKELIVKTKRNINKDDENLL